MKFKGKKVELGTRFYIFVSEDEFRIVTLVKSNEHEGQFMDEETFEITTISSKKLNANYTMLCDNDIWLLSNFRLKPEFEKDKSIVERSIWLYNQNVTNFMKSEYISYPFKVSISFKLFIYSFMKKSVFNKTINYIIQFNFPKFQISEDDINNIWEEYFRFINNKNVIIDCSSYSDKLDMNQVINNKAKIPDSIIDEAEEILNIPILSYEPYEFDDSINLNNINMKHFFIYINDIYYVILYVIDTIKDAINIQTNLQNHMDVVQFMLK